MTLTGCACGNARQLFQSAEHLGQGVPAGDLVEAITLQRIDRDVEPVGAGIDQRPRVPLEQVAVGGDRDLVHIPEGGQHLHQPGEVAADERLAAGQPHVVDPHRGQHADETANLLEAQDLLALQPGEPLGRHAVLAAEIAAIGDRHPQVADHSAVTVGEGVDRHHVQRLPWRSVRLSVLLIALGLALTVGGCGSAPSSPVRAKIDQFAADARRHDFQAICDQVLATALLERLAAAGVSCPGAVAGALGNAAQPVISIGRVRVSGSRAAAITLSAAAGQAASLSEIDLVRESGGWRISALAGPGSGLR